MIFTMPIIIGRCNDVVQYDAIAQLKIEDREKQKKWETGKGGKPKKLSVEEEESRLEKLVQRTMKDVIRPGHLPANTLDLYIWYQKEGVKPPGRFYIMRVHQIEHVKEPIDYDYIVEKVLNPTSELGFRGKHLDGSQADGVVVCTAGHCLGITMDKSKVGMMNMELVFDSFPSKNGSLLSPSLSVCLSLLFCLLLYVATWNVADLSRDVQ